MGSKAIELPVIDFSGQDLKPGTEAWNSTKIEVRTALENFGCFQVLFDKIPSEVRKSLFDSSAELFDLPSQTKSRISSSRPFQGYVGQQPQVPLYESVGIEEPTLYENVERVSDLMWPHGNSNFSKTIWSYSEQLSELDKMVRRMVLESLGLEKYLDEHMNSTDYLLRLMKYKESQTNEPKVGLLTHTDKSMVTILHQNQVKGLEILTKDGHWIEVNLSTNSYIVLVGDSLHAWTNGRVYAPSHRVMMSGNETRYSVGLFTLPKVSYEIKAPKEVVDEDHPLLFKPFNHVQFLAFAYSEAGQKSKSALQAYCGV